MADLLSDDMTGALFQCFLEVLDEFRSTSETIAFLSQTEPSKANLPGRKIQTSSDKMHIYEKSQTLPFVYPPLIMFIRCTSKIKAELAAGIPAT